jgi:hypothetical protein
VFGDILTMIAFDVYLNGKKVCTAGGDDLTELSAAVYFFPRRHRRDNLGPTLAVAGVAPRPEEFFEWAYSRLRVGDKVQVKVVEAPRADKALHRRRPAYAR